MALPAIPSEAGNVELLVSATRGFNYLFSNDLYHAKEHFAGGDDPYHLLGQGVCAFMEAALGMETGLLAEASRCLSLSEAGSRRQMKNVVKSQAKRRFTPGLEFEILNADAVVLLGLTNALSESYMGYLQCMYSLNSAHSKFSKLYKTVFPNGLDAYTTPSATPAPSRKSSTLSLHSSLSSPPSDAEELPPDGPIEDLIISGTAFGYGLFNLVFSLLPKKVQLVLMTYYGVVLLLSGYQADEAHIIKQYKAIVTSIEARFPQGALWILNRAKIMRMSYDPEGAIKVLRDGLRPDRPHSFAQADTLLVFELAWTLLGQRRYQEAADMFIKVTELNSWSHGTYYFLAAGCYISLGNTTKAQALLDVVPDLIDKKKISGKDLPTEVLIKKKLAFYQEKQKRRGGDPKLWAQAIKISIAEELGLFWNTHARIERRLARAHIREWSALTPPRPLSIADAATPIPPVSPVVPTSARPDIDTPDEHAIRHLLIGMCERTAGEYAAARESLKAACELQSEIKVSTWVGGVAMFELAVLDLKEVEAGEMEAGVGAFGEGGAKGVHEAVRRLTEWDKATKAAGKKLEAAMALARSEVDLSSRLDSRVSMLRDEIAAKREALGI
ncbi:Mitochondrial outer membrane protein IML2 [Termitomyces sp. J132]|nr:Mitochondrial outer membrane protein IML2 [Termitomyces sp. J132]